MVSFNKRKSKLKWFLKDAELEGIPFTKSRILLHFGYGWQYEYLAKDLKAAIGSEAALTVSSSVAGITRLPPSVCISQFLPLTPTPGT